MIEHNKHPFYSKSVSQREKDLEALKTMKEIEYYLKRSNNVEKSEKEIYCGKSYHYRLPKGTIGKVKKLLNELKNKTNYETGTNHQSNCQ